ncbi:MAG: hypothetical protein CMB56_006465 [Methanobacteriota archaeon]|nr:MAG: hypothetical protein CMB56_006465 [Euryarchaeota archaeon]|tara:strand:- start:127 stop:447 length:321 start_codon:yes stop_codon:yes gene_type:complete
MKFCPNCKISLDKTWEICPTCSQALSPQTIKQAGGTDQKVKTFASNLPWYFHLIPVVIAMVAIIIADYVSKDSPAFVKLIFPPASLILGGFIGLLILKGISDNLKN